MHVTSRTVRVPLIHVVYSGYTQNTSDVMEYGAEKRHCVNVNVMGLDLVARSKIRLIIPWISFRSPPRC